MENPTKAALQAIYSDVDLDEMALIQLKNFLKSEKCCMTYPKFYNAFYRQKIINLAEQYTKTSTIALKCRIHEFNGLKFVKVYKPNCSSYCQEDTKFQLTENSKKIICKYLNECTLSLREQVDLSPGFQKPDIIAKPRIQIYHFSMTKQSNALAIPPKSKNISMEASKCEAISIINYREKILKSIKEYQVVILTHDIGIDKLAIAEFILDNASTNFEHCRIVYSNNQKLIAVKNCETIAKRRGEVTGLTTGYQIPLKSVSSCNKTNLLFTSTTYFLRCLMGVNSKDAFYGITHVILDDVHERNFRIDLLLFEIREVLSFYPNLKLLLLCLNPFNTKPFEDYFKNMGSLNLKLDLQIENNIQVHYLNKILKMINYMTPEMETYLNLSYRNKTITLNDKESQLTLNNLLDRYINECDVEAFDKFCYFVQIEHIPVDVQHSEYLMNMLMGSAKHNKVEHLNTLLKMNANIYLTDNKNRTALDWAKISNSIHCTYEIQRILDSRTADEKFPEQVQRFKAYNFTRTMNLEVDHKLIIDLIKFLHQNSKVGTILTIVASYDDMLKIQFHLENYFQLHKIKNYKIFKLHKSNKISEIDEILKMVSTDLTRKIIISTQAAESFLYLNDVIHIIDSGLIKLSNHTTGTQKIQWISKDRAERRKCMAGISNTLEATCFRIYTIQDYSNFSPVTIPELLHIPLDNVCLFVKVLSPYTTIKEYFMRTICTPSNGQIEKSILLLKSIGAFEEQESITILGMRMVDIPLPVQLGKVLIYSIFMQCLDPVLTIISILQCNDQLVLPNLENNGQTLYLCKENLAENSNSDHLTFLRIFQKWQDDRLEFVFHPMSEAQYLLDQNLQVICEIRSEIVGIVRSAQLIHANGLLSMNYINSCANNWAMVKACFVAGMYPNVCRIESDHTKADRSEIQFKCNSTECIRKMFLYPGSVLRDLAPDSWNKKSSTYQTDWLFYQNSVHREKICRIHNSSLVTPITIAIFAGSLKKSEEDIVNDGDVQDNLRQYDCVETRTKNKSRILIDDWISFKISEEDAYLIFNLRQKFSHIFLDLLQNCDNHERIQRFRRHYIDKLKILEIISKILQNEDINYSFPQLERIGDRPKALPLSCTSELNIMSEEVSNLTDFDFSNKVAATGENHRSVKDEIQNNNNEINPKTSISDDSFVNSYLERQHLKSSNYLSSDINNSVGKTWNNTSQLSSNNNIEQKSLVSDSSTPKYNTTYQNISLFPGIQTQNTTSLLTINNLENNGIAQAQTNVPSNEILQYATQNAIKFFILPCWNRNDAAEYFSQNKIKRNCLPIWHDICLDFTKNPNVIHYVFLFDVEETCFCSSGFIIWNETIDGIRLHEIFKVEFTLDNLIARLKLEKRNTNLINYVGFGEIHFEFGYDLLRCMEIFQKMLEDE